MAKTVKMTPLKLDRFKKKAEAADNVDLLDQFRFTAGEVSSSTDATIMQNAMEKLFVLRELIQDRMVSDSSGSAEDVKTDTNVSTEITDTNASKQEPAAKSEKATPAPKAETASKASNTANKATTAKAEDKVPVKA